MPTSDKRAAANRANAAKSTGPTTPEGKKRSSQNALKHGFAAGAFTTVRIESLASLEALRAEAIAVYQPVNSQELLAVERIALAQHALFRLAALEAGLCSIAVNEVMNLVQTPDIILCDDILRGAQIAKSQNQSYTFAVGFQRTTGANDSWKLFLRYQAQTERNYRRAVEDFDRLKALRPELPNEPIESVASQPVTPEVFLDQPRELDEYDQALRANALADPVIELRPVYQPAPPPQKPKTK